ncbi:hypothetical protein BY996DRAFT_7102502, partial [Phakopsora pachyrhizi]
MALYRSFGLGFFFSNAIEILNLLARGLNIKASSLLFHVLTSSPIPIMTLVWVLLIISGLIGVLSDLTFTPSNMNLIESL